MFEAPVCNGVRSDVTVTSQGLRLFETDALPAWLAETCHEGTHMQLQRRKSGQRPNVTVVAPWALPGSSQDVQRYYRSQSHTEFYIITIRTATG